MVLKPLAAPLLVPHDPIEQNLYHRLEPPWLAHPLGTDDFGRDILSRIIYGSRISLRIGLISISIALTGGTGLGAQPPTPEWGAMLSDGRELLLKAPWVMSFPGLAIFVLVLALNLFGDGLRDALDPKRVTAR